MGTRMAPNYANIFMNDLETKFLSTREIKPFFYKRFLDDVFLIWTGTEDDLIDFIECFNKAHPSIAFTYTYSTTEINFLDVHINTDKGELITTVYKKPTDRQQYLHFDSCHPRHCKTSIPYSQAHRFRRICSRTEDFEANAENLRNVLAKQQYPPPIVNDAICKAVNLDRQELLHHEKELNQKGRGNLVLTFGGNSPNINKILKKHFNMLQQSERLSKIFPTPPRVVYRRPKNIKDYLVHAKTERAPKGGCRPCGKARCRVCKHMQTTTVAESTNSNFKHLIHATLDCDSSNVVYLLECGVCGIQYIGQTDTAFRMRFNNHRAHVRSLPDLPLSRHINSENHPFDSIRVTLLQSGFSTTREREQRESYIIYKFNTVKAGMNVSPGIMSSIHAVDNLAAE